MSKEKHPFVSLRGASPIGKGRYRLVFLHPDDDTKCIKIEHGERTEKPKSPLGLIRPAVTGNDRELSEYRRLIAAGVEYDRYFPRFYGVVDTDLGQGICVEVLKGSDGKPPMSIKEYLHENRPPPRDFCLFFREEYRKFAEFCAENLIMSASTGFENVAIIQVGGAPKLVSFDVKGITSKQLIPLAAFAPFLKKRRIRRRFGRQLDRMDALFPV
jgi:hypothetical protein